MATVSLSLAEVDAAINAARLRILSSVGLNHASTYQRNILLRIHEEIVGALGEIAFAKHLNIFSIPSIGTFHRTPDVGNFEVRSTDRVDGRLILRDNDDPGRRYVLAIVRGMEVDLVGWIHGRDGMIDAFKANPKHYRPAWFVPRDHLHPMKADLPSCADGR